MVEGDYKKFLAIAKVLDGDRYWMTTFFASALEDSPVAPI